MRYSMSVSSSGRCACRSALELDDSKMADKASVENEETTIAKDIVVTKYKMAAEIVNGKCALKSLVYRLRKRSIVVRGATKHTRRRWKPRAVNSECFG